jgi:hypothetical protein
MHESNRIGDHVRLREKRLASTSSRFVQQRRVRQAGMRKKQVKALLEHRLEIVRQPKLRDRREKIGVAAHPRRVAAIEGDREAGLLDLGLAGPVLSDTRIDAGEHGEERLVLAAAAVAVEIEPHACHVDRQPDLFRSDLRQRCVGAPQVLGELRQDGPEAVVGERLRLRVRRHRHAQDRDERRSGRLEPVPIERLSEPFDRACELRRAECEADIAALAGQGRQFGFPADQRPPIGMPAQELIRCLRAGGRGLERDGQDDGCEADNQGHACGPRRAAEREAEVPARRAAVR